jgi:hypothetical protein
MYSLKSKSEIPTIQIAEDRTEITHEGIDKEIDNDLDDANKLEEETDTFTEMQSKINCEIKLNEATDYTTTINQNNEEDTKKVDEAYISYKSTVLKYVIYHINKHQKLGHLAKCFSKWTRIVRVLQVILLEKELKKLEEIGTANDTIIQMKNIIETPNQEELVETAVEALTEAPLKSEARGEALAEGATNSADIQFKKTIKEAKVLPRLELSVREKCEVERSQISIHKDEFNKSIVENKSRFYGVPVLTKRSAKDVKEIFEEEDVKETVLHTDRGNYNTGNKKKRGILQKFREMFCSRKAVV